MTFTDLAGPLAFLVLGLIVGWVIGLKQEHARGVKRWMVLCEFGWGVIANAGGGNWEKEGKEWKGAAIRWRDEYFSLLRSADP